MKFSKKIGGRKISNYNTTLLRDNRVYNSSNKNRSINNKIKKYKYSTNIKYNKPHTNNKQTKMGFYDKATEERMNLKDYPGPCPYYSAIVHEDNYIFYNGKLVKNNKPIEFKYRPPGPNISRINFNRKNSKRFNFNRKNSKRSKNKKNPQNNLNSQNNNPYDNYNQLTGGGIHWDNLNPQKIYLNAGPPALIDHGNTLQTAINLNRCTAAVYSNSEGFGFQHSDMVCYPGCGPGEGDRAAQGPSEGYQWNERFFTMFACGGIINKIEGLEGGGGSENFNLLFMERPRGRCYTMSHFISRQAWQGKHSWLPAKGVPVLQARSWVLTYIRWMLRSCISLMTTAYSDEEWSIKDVGGHTYFRYIFDYNNALMLASPELRKLWGDPQDPEPQNNPWAYMCHRDLYQGGIDDFPITNEGDVACRDMILKVWEEFLVTYRAFDNYLDQYLYLWWLAGKCGGFFDFGAGTPKYSRVEVFLYRYPWASTDNSGPQGSPAQHEPMGMGQITRFLSLIQKPYKNSIPFAGPGTEVNPAPTYPMGKDTPELTRLEGTGTVFPPLTIHLRDGHSSATSNQSIKFDAAWEDGTFRYMICKNPSYCTEWHEGREGWLAGVFSAKKDPNNETMMTISTWKETFGRAFAWHQNGDNPYLTICPSRGMGHNRDSDGGKKYNKQGQWGYGIEEFLGSWMLLDNNRLTGWQQGAEENVRKIFCNTLWVGSMGWLNYIHGETMTDYNTRKIWDYNSSFDTNIAALRETGWRHDSPCPSAPCYVNIFFAQYNCLSWLSFEFCYWYIRWKESTEVVTWRDVREKLKEIKEDFTIAIADPVKLTEFRTNKEGIEAHAFDENFVRFLVLIFPPVYAYLTTLFSNGSSWEMLEQPFPTQYKNEGENGTTVVNHINTLRDNSLNYSEDANIIYNIQRLNSIYALQSEPNPPRDGTGIEIQKNLQNGFDIREWYAPDKHIKIQWRTHNHQEQPSPNWYFVCRRGNGQELDIDLWTDLNADRHGAARQGCADSWFLFPEIGS